MRPVRSLKTEFNAFDKRAEQTYFEKKNGTPVMFSNYSDKPGH